MMMTTFTNTPSTTAHIDYDFTGALPVIESGGLVLLPTDTLWCVACDATNEQTLRQLRAFCPPTDDFPIEVLFSSLPMLRAYTGHIHPRLETLLELHRRPLSVVLKEPRYLPPAALNNDNELVARVVQDQLCLHLVSCLGHPLAVALARRDESVLPNSFGRIRSDILQEVDHVVRYRQRDIMAPCPSVMVQLGVEEELDFIRE